MQSLKTICTRFEAQKYLESLDLPESAIEALLKESALDRHNWRTGQALEAAKRWVVNCWRMEENKIGANVVRASVSAVLFADCFGVGGHLGVGGASTRRHPALTGLGKGRKNATDGPAWSAAIRAAAEHCRGYFAPSRLDDICLAYYVDNLNVVVLINSVLIPFEWQLTIAREGLRRSFGLDAWFPDLRGYLKVDGDNCADWAQLVAHLTEELEKAKQIEEQPEEQPEDQPEEQPEGSAST
jgi:hypothetical protein